MNSETISRFALPVITRAQRDVLYTVLRDELASEIADRMAETELGKTLPKQGVRDICRAFACNLRRYVEGKYQL
jgi:hypothetical protein